MAPLGPLGAVFSGCTPADADEYLSTGQVLAEHCWSPAREGCRDVRGQRELSGWHEA